MERLNAEHEAARLLIQVHDELVLEAPTDEADAVRDVTVDVMVNALPLDVPLRVDAAVGPNWLEGKS
jgi:DNA polymerase-1